MSVLIKGMDMPTCCSNCDFHEGGYPDWCNLSVCNYREIDNDKIVQEWCPLVEVPTVIVTGESPTAQPDVPDTNVGDMISRQATIKA